MSSQDSNQASNLLNPSNLEQVQLALSGLRFGSVQIIVQDGLIIQIDRTEKIRLNNKKP